MASVREHLTKFHGDQAAHHVAMAKISKRLSEQHGALAESQDGEAGEHAEIAKAHSDAASAHTAAAESNLACCKALGSSSRKADETDSLVKTVAGDGVALDVDLLSAIVSKAVTDALANKLVPDSVRAVIPSNAPNAGIRAVPRHGQQPIDTTDVPPELAHMFKVEL